MKKTCLALLAAAALPAFASLDIAAVDIEGIKLGMNEEEAAVFVQAYCETNNKEYRKEREIKVNEIEFNMHACYDSKLDIIPLTFFSLNNRVASITKFQKIALENNKKDFINDLLSSIQKKAIQKYSEPSLEANNLPCVFNGGESPRTFLKILCWGECKKQKSSSGKNVLETKGVALIIGLNIEEETAIIVRALQDETAISAAQKNAPKTEAEKAAAKVNL